MENITWLWLHVPTAKVNYKPNINNKFLYTLKPTSYHFLNRFYTIKMWLLYKYDVW